jgi:hypothetical protein
MSNFTAGALTLHVAIEKFALKEPFHITGHSMVDTDVVTVTLEQGGHSGRGEASGVYHRKCKVVDLDGPEFLSTDRDIAARYSGGFISCEDMPWGNSNHEHAQ